MFYSYLAKEEPKCKSLSAPIDARTLPQVLALPVRGLGTGNGLISEINMGRGYLVVLPGHQHMLDTQWGPELNETLGLSIRC